MLTLLDSLPLSKCKCMFSLSWHSHAAPQTFLGISGNFNLVLKKKKKKSPAQHGRTASADLQIWGGQRQDTSPASRQLHSPFKGHTPHRASLNLIPLYSSYLFFFDNSMHNARTYRLMIRETNFKCGEGCVWILGQERGHKNRSTWELITLATH